jgi:hypothetical protein
MKKLLVAFRNISNAPKMENIIGLSSLLPGAVSAFQCTNLRFDN